MGYQIKRSQQYARMSTDIVGAYESKREREKQQKEKERERKRRDEIEVKKGSEKQKGDSKAGYDP